MYHSHLWKLLHLRFKHHVLGDSFEADATQVQPARLVGVKTQYLHCRAASRKVFPENLSWSLLRGSERHRPSLHHPSAPLSGNLTNFLGFCLHFSSLSTFKVRLNAHGSCACGGLISFSLPELCKILHLLLLSLWQRCSWRSKSFCSLCVRQKIWGTSFYLHISG